MSIRGYVLVETAVGHTLAVGRAIRQITPQLATIISVDTVTGPFDVIVQIEADDLDRLGKAITEDLQTVEGVERTTTCLSVNL